MKKSPASSEASPYKSVADELETFRKAFRSLAHRYTSRVEAEIAGIRDTILEAAETASPENGGAPAGETGNGFAAPARKQRANRKTATITAERQSDQIRDLRDMLTLLRTFEFNPDIAKRRDFKQVENVLEEMRQLTGRWA